MIFNDFQYCTICSKKNVIIVFSLTTSVLNSKMMV